jgi:hypothetical protein
MTEQATERLIRRVLEPNHGGMHRWRIDHADGSFTWIWIRPSGNALIDQGMAERKFLDTYQRTKAPIRGLRLDQP